MPRIAAALLVLAATACQESPGSGAPPGLPAAEASADSTPLAAPAAAAPDTAAGFESVMLGTDAIEPDTVRLAAGRSVQLHVLNTDGVARSFDIGRHLSEDAFREPFFAGIPTTRGGPVVTTEPQTRGTGEAPPAVAADRDRLHRRVAMILQPGETAVLTLTPPAAKSGVWTMLSDAGNRPERRLTGVLVVR